VAVAVAVLVQVKMTPFSSLQILMKLAVEAVAVAVDFLQVLLVMEEVVAVLVMVQQVV
jgi:hypothetical protein